MSEGGRGQGESKGVSAQSINDHVHWVWFLPCCRVYLQQILRQVFFHGEVYQAKLSNLGYSVGLCTAIA